MSEPESPDFPSRDTLSGYEVVFHTYRSGVTASIFEVGYTRGRRRLVKRSNYQLLHPAPDPSRSAEDAVALLLADLLELLAPE